MNELDRKSELTLEVILVLVTAALACLLYYIDGLKLVVLNLFFLPVVLAGFFLGRYRAGILALFSVAIATIVISLDLAGFASMASPVAVGLSVTLWGAVLGLTALLVGTLCDDRDAKSLEAHEAHVGVVEVLSSYLQSANPNLESRARKVASLSEEVARKMRMSSREIDDIRVAALLMDMENVEITARVIRKAVGELESDKVEQRTIHGSELVHSLGTVLTGAFPLLINQTDGSGSAGAEVPFGARIIRTVRGYIQLAEDPWDGHHRTPEEVLAELRCDIDADYHPAVVHAIDAVLAPRRKAAADQSTSAAELVGV